MNFYKHHLGDYDGATAHLSWDEDHAYTRLLRVYYRLEKQIPADLAAACRLVRATSKPQRKAVEAVLREFFELQDDGWHNKRADEEITAYRAQADTNRRIARTRTVQRNADDSSTKGTPNHEPLAKNQEPENKTVAVDAAIPAAPANGKAVEYIPLNDGSQFAVSSAYAQELARLYPKVDVPQTLREIRGHNLALDVADRKAPENIKRHIDSWMRREMNGTAKA